MLEMCDAGEGGGECDDGAVMDLDVIINGMTPAQDGQLMLAPYLHAYIQMNKIFRHVGPFFQFAANDVAVKVRLLWKLLDGSSGHHYTSIQSMIAYERDNNLLTPKGGCRTLLRLHRALEFVMEFARELINTNDDEPFNTATSRLYNNTVGLHQNIVMVKTFTGIVLTFMPSRKTLLERLSHGDAGTEEELRRGIPRMVDAMLGMFNNTQRLLHDNNMLNLP